LGRCTLLICFILINYRSGYTIPSQTYKASVQKILARNSKEMNTVRTGGDLIYFHLLSTGLQLHNQPFTSRGNCKPLTTMGRRISVQFHTPGCSIYVHLWYNYIKYCHSQYPNGTGWLENLCSPGIDFIRWVNIIKSKSKISTLPFNFDFDSFTS